MGQEGLTVGGMVNNYAHINSPEEVSVSFNISMDNPEPRKKCR